MIFTTISVDGYRVTRAFTKSLVTRAITGCCLVSPSVFSMPAVVNKTIDSAKLMIQQHVEYPFYMGLGAGYGDTDWSQITTLNDPFNPATESSPISSSAKQIAFDAYIGYQFSEHFAVESIYTRYPQTTLGFQLEGSGSSFPNIYGIDTLTTNTDSYSLLGKIFVPFGFTKVNVYADAGVTVMHRHDISVTKDPDAAVMNYVKQNTYKAGPSFGFGVAMNVTKRLFSEIGFQYTTGYGKADVNVAEEYIPFAYSILFNMGVRI